MDDRVAAIRARHQEDPRLFWFTRDDGSRDEFHYCTACGTGSTRWPCEVDTLRAALDATEQARVVVEETLADTAAILQEERDRATRLAALEAAAQATLVAYCEHGDPWAVVEALKNAVAALDGPARDAPLPSPDGTMPSQGGG